MNSVDTFEFGYPVKLANEKWEPLGNNGLKVPKVESRDVPGRDIDLQGALGRLWRGKPVSVMFSNVHASKGRLPTLP